MGICFKACLVYFLIVPRTTRPRPALSTVRQPFPYQLSIKKMTLKENTFPLVSLIRNFPQLRFLLPKFSSLWQIDTKISQHKVSIEYFITEDISKPSDPRFRAITENVECFKEYRPPNQKKPDQNSVLLDMGGLLHYKNHSSCCCQHKINLVTAPQWRNSITGEELLPFGDWYTKEISLFFF